MLVDYSEIRSLAFGGQTGAIDEELFNVDKVIKGVIKTVERYLNRPLERGIYEQFGEEDVEHSVIVKPFDSESVTPDPSKVRGHKVMFSGPKSSFQYEGGWTKETLPRDIKQVIFRLVSYEYNQAVRNVYGITSKTVVTGSTTANVTKEDNNVYLRELAKLLQYKNMNFYSWVERKPNEQD